jgi:hypothetical protein
MSEDSISISKKRQESEAVERQGERAFSFAKKKKRTRKGLSMPAKSRSQQKFFGAELSRKRAGKETRTGLAEATIEDFAATKLAKLPEKVKPKAKKR